VFIELSYLTFVFIEFKRGVRLGIGTKLLLMRSQGASVLCAGTLEMEIAMPPANTLVTMCFPELNACCRGHWISLFFCQRYNRTCTGEGFFGGGDFRSCMGKGTHAFSAEIAGAETAMPETGAFTPMCSSE
jgi:hypothetical protein